jgi:hypothetical protein
VSDQGESIRFWQTAPLAGVELLSARYIEHRFAPHVHDGYVIGMIMAGAQRYRYRGAEHLAGSGTLVLINPDELHTGHKGTEDGWLYRAFYPDTGQIVSCSKNWNCPARRCRRLARRCTATRIWSTASVSCTACWKARPPHCNSRRCGAK